MNDDKRLDSKTQHCHEFKKSVLTIPRNRYYTSLHQNVEIRKSLRKGHFAIIKENTKAFEVLGVEKPIVNIVFDPKEYQWRRFPSSLKRYKLIINYILKV